MKSCYARKHAQEEETKKAEGLPCDTMRPLLFGKKAISKGPQPLRNLQKSHLREKRAAKEAASIRPQRFRQARLRPLPVFFAQSRAPFLSEILANPEESLKIASVNANFRFCSHIGQLSLAYSPCRKETPPPTDNNAFRGASPCARTSDWIDCKPARAGRTRSGYLLQTTIFDGALHTPSCDAPSLVLREKLILQKNPADDFKTIRRRDYLF